MTKNRHGPKNPTGEGDEEPHGEPHGGGLPTDPTVARTPERGMVQRYLANRATPPSQEGNATPIRPRHEGPQVSKKKDKNLCGSIMKYFSKQGEPQARQAPPRNEGQGEGGPIGGAQVSSKKDKNLNESTLNYFSKQGEPQTRQAPPHNEGQNEGGPLDLPEDQTAHIHRMETALKEKRRAAREILERYDPQWDYSGLGKIETMKHPNPSNKNSYRNMHEDQGTVRQGGPMQVCPPGLARSHKNMGKCHTTNTKE